ncbi:universal stress protein [Luteipulveratus halotolerans]|uniref:universal stress protein n=1 Tax=Luteipulveratus halotolerans TaxID=1631356 RepID=UPI001E3F62AF|nr:universal stress protein [Luteipulveratus halotolerans]
MHATCPVAVVNPGVDVEAELKGEIVVGVDGSRDSAAAAEIAFAAAAARGSHVTCLSSWYLEVADGVVVTDEDTPQRRAIDDRQRERVESAITAAREAHPDVAYDIEVVNGPSSKVLAARSEQADVLVLGTRGRGGFAGKLLGSVSQKVLQAAQCPVVVVKSKTD